MMKSRPINTLRYKKIIDEMIGPSKDVDYDAIINAMVRDNRKKNRKSFAVTESLYKRQRKRLAAK